MEDHERRLQLARESLEGLSVGDALGEALSYKFYEARQHADFSVFRDGSVRYTDDTEMAIGIIETLGLLRAIDQDALAWRFATRFTADPHRGYGRMAPGSSRRSRWERTGGASRPRPSGVGRSGTEPRCGSRRWVPTMLGPSRPLRKPRDGPRK